MRRLHACDRGNGIQLRWDCGQVCDDVMDFLPLDDGRPAAPPIGNVDPTAYGEVPDEATKATGLPFEWETSRPRRA